MLNNTIYGNSGFQFENGSGNNLDATNNYWGTNDPAKIASSIYDHSKNSSLGTVSFEPYLITPDPCAPLMDVPQFYQGYPSTPASITPIESVTWRDYAYGNYLDGDKKNTIGYWGCNTTSNAMIINYFAG